jgi:protein-tyrosine phosphatase
MTTHPPSVLTVCTANQCRSPTAAALLSRSFAERGIPASISSVGLDGGGFGVPAPLASIAAARGLDLSAHRSRAVEAQDVESADLVLCMAREHVRAVVLIVPSKWPQVFTLREFVRRASTVGFRQPGQALDEWLASVHLGRVHADLLGASAEDDIADPIGGPEAGYVAMIDEVGQLCAAVVELGWAVA